MPKPYLKQCKSCSKIFESQVDYSTICKDCETEKEKKKCPFPFCDCLDWCKTKKLNKQ